MPAQAVNGTTAYASGTWRLRIYIDMYFQSPDVTSIDVFQVHCAGYGLKPQIWGSYRVTRIWTKLTFSETIILGLSKDTKIVSIGLKVWSQITSVSDRRTDR